MPEFGVADSHVPADNVVAATLHAIDPDPGFRIWKVCAAGAVPLDAATKFIAV